MKKILQSNILFVLLLMIGTGCIARILKNQLSNNDHFHQLIQKDSANDFGCSIMEGPIYICNNQAYGTVCFSFDGPGTECLYVNFNANVNISNTDINCHQNHYNGNIIATLNFTETYNSNIMTSQRLTTSLTQTIVKNFTTTANTYFCDEITLFDITLCDNDSCDAYSFQGYYNISGSNNTCTELYIEAMIQ